MSTTKSTGATKLGRDAQPKYLGIKISDGQGVRKGMIIIRQRGTKYRPGKNVKRGEDDTLYAAKDGIVKFQKKRVMHFDSSQSLATYVNIQ